MKTENEYDNNTGNVILVTGGAGYIGSHTVQKLIEKGYKVVVVDDLSTGFKESIPKGAEFIQADIKNTFELEKIFNHHNINSVIHFAAKLIVPESVTFPELYYENNIGGLTSLLKMMRQFKVRSLVFSSTAAVYGDVVESAKNHLITETSPVAPLNPYGLSKYMCEQILKDAEKAFDLKHVILRYFNVAGAQSDISNGQRTLNATHLIKVAAEYACEKRNKIEIFGTDYPTPDGTCIRDYIHIEDLADIHVLALDHLKNNNNSGLFNCGYGHGFSVREVLKAMENVSGKKFSITEAPRRDGDASALVADPTLIKSKFHWNPRFDDLEKICQTAYLWEKSR